MTDRELRERMPDDIGRLNMRPLDDLPPPPERPVQRYGVWVLERRSRRRSSRIKLLALSSPPRTVRGRDLSRARDEGDEAEEPRADWLTSTFWLLVGLGIGLALVIRPAIQFILEVLGPVAQPDQ